MAGFSLSNIDLRILSVFVNVVEHEGMSAAAVAADVSLSTITRDIAGLETRLGMRLCRRGRSGFSLTDNGRDVYQAAKQLLEDVRHFELRVASSRKMLSGALEIGIIDNMVTNPKCNVIATLDRLHHEIPDLKVRVSLHPVSMISVLVRERKIDIGFTGKPEFLTPLEHFHAFDETHMLFISRRCAAFERVTSAFSALLPGERLNEPLPYVARTFPTDQFMEFESRLNLQTKAVGTSLEGVLTAILAGIGCGILPVHAAKSADSLVALQNVPGGLRIPFYMIFRKDAAEQRPVKTFVRLYREANDAPEFTKL